ncbi:hypothetical protein BDA96_09G014600 [Sorghum bicolor]|uniref:Uncharacterized protein n=2 Tax=Sorghum bicolor TaxID=4558 RepID=A0A921Q9F5_SORBI|nr:hypothetical protein BDA96_09G014600 [Sorghum bicolor]OQU77239.1 hypothetical protein SORBI_3009G014266 [Sorghum bicolor]
MNPSLRASKTGARREEAKGNAPPQHRPILPSVNSDNVQGLPTCTPRTGRAGPSALSSRRRTTGRSTLGE